MRILIISPHFPTPDVYENLAHDPRSKFLLRYAINFVKLGHSVSVLHVPPLYPRIFDFIAGISCRFSFLKKYNFARFVQNKDAIAKADYEFQGVSVKRRPLTKFIPGAAYPPIQLFFFRRKIIKEYCSDIGAYDLILADYLSPSLDVSREFVTGSNVKLYPIIHNTDESYFNASKVKYSSFINKCDGVLYRSKALENKFRRSLSSKLKCGFLYSGVPDGTDFGVPRSRVRKFLYVGALRKSKNIHHLINAFAQAYKQFPDIHLDIVGDGEYRAVLMSLVNSLSLSTIVKFHGKLDHSRVFSAMRSADCLVMVSKETFGMVYIEAMSQGCVVIAAKGEGIDGVITDSINGFLIEIDDVEALAAKLAQLIKAEEHVVSAISQQSLITAKNMTDQHLAKELLIDIGAP